MYLKSNTKITRNPLSLFFSYAHRDQQLRDQLEAHLSFLKRVDRIITWHDRIIRPGEEWKNKTDDKINQADIILLLISPAFAKSDYCYDIEMMRAMERHERSEAIVIPVILRPTSNWQDSPFGKLQALPADNKAVTSWRNRDAAFKAVADGIRSIIDGRQSSSFFAVDLHKWTLTVDGDFASFSEERIQALTSKLFGITNDPLLSFIEKSSGSVCLKFQSTRAALSKIQEIYQDGALEKLLGLSIHSFSEDLGALIRIETKVVASDVQSFTKYLPEVFGSNAIEEGWAPFVTGMAIPRNNPIQPGFKLALNAAQAELSDSLLVRPGRHENRRQNPPADR